jgi:hypothetical protein
MVFHLTQLESPEIIILTFSNQCIRAVKKGLLAANANLDFTSIPYWGDDSHLEIIGQEKDTRQCQEYLVL